MNVLKFLRLGDHELPLPRRAKEGDSGLDLAAVPIAEKFAAGERKIIPVGFAVEIPLGYEGQIRPKSSSRRRGHFVEFGTIDSGYRGELAIQITAEWPLTIRRGELIGQLVIVPIVLPESVEVDALSSSSRGSGGWGSTGSQVDERQIKVR